MEPNLKRLPHRLLLVAVGGILIITVAMCGLGVRLTLSQYQDVEGILLRAEERAAESQLSALETYLEEHERQALTELLAAHASPDALASLVDSYPFLQWPFFIYRDGTLFAPHLRPRSSSLLRVGAAPAPERLEHALGLGFSTAPWAERVKALEEVYGSHNASASSRLRVRAARAALHHRRREFEDAERIYESIFEEFSATLPLSVPTRLHLCLARAENLAQLERPQDCLAALRAGVRCLEDGSEQYGLDEEAFFLERGRNILADANLRVPVEMEKAGRELMRERLARTATETLRDWIVAQLQAESPRARAVNPQNYFARFSGRPNAAVWSAVPRSPSGPDLLAVGFQIDPRGLQEFLESRLSPGVQGERLQILLDGDAPAGDLVLLASFQDELSLLGIGVRREAWNSLVGRARRPFVVAGVLIGLLGVLLIISVVVLFRMVRRELALAGMKSEFVANVSHELKTPLSLIRLCAETLQLDRLRDEEQRDKYYQVIIRETKRLGYLISNVLSFSRMEAGKSTHHLKPCDLGDVVLETFEDFRFQLDEKDFESSLEVAPDLPEVLADREAVAQALTNLLQNAADYSTDRKKIEVTVAAGDSAVRIVVRDHGLGIDADDQRRIWEEYYRSRQARALGTRGSGLGLSLVLRIMKAHRGTVELVSRPGRGSEFTLVFPVAPEFRQESSSAVGDGEGRQEQSAGADRQRGSE